MPIFYVAYGRKTDVAYGRTTEKAPHIEEVEADRIIHIGDVRRVMAKGGLRVIQKGLYGCLDIRRTFRGAHAALLQQAEDNLREVQELAPASPGGSIIQECKIALDRLYAERRASPYVPNEVLRRRAGAYLRGVSIISTNVDVIRLELSMGRVAILELAEVS